MAGKQAPDLDQMIEALQQRKAQPQTGIFDTFMRMLYPQRATPQQLPQFDEFGNPMQPRTAADLLRKR